MQRTAASPPKTISYCRQGEEALRPPCMTWTTIVICWLPWIRWLLGYQGVAQRLFKNAMLAKRLRSKQVEFSQAVMQTENRQFRQYRETGDMSLFSGVSPADSRQTNVPASLVVSKREETARRTKCLTFKGATRAGHIMETRIDTLNEGPRDQATGYGLRFQLTQRAPPGTGCRPQV